MTNGETREIAVFGGGCFWCTEAVFKMLKGVYSVEPGYFGGSTENPTYEEVCSGDTGHVECVKVEFNPKIISYKDLLKVFFGSHDPTTLDRQGNDIGTQYASVIFYSNDKQKKDAESFIKRLNTSNKNGKMIVTKIRPLDRFCVAENYHRDYYERNRGAPYCELIINPKLEKVQKQLETLLKTHKKQKLIA